MTYPGIPWPPSKGATVRVKASGLLGTIERIDDSGEAQRFTLNHLAPAASKSTHQMQIDQMNARQDEVIEANRSGHSYTLVELEPVSV